MNQMTPAVSSMLLMLYITFLPHWSSLSTEWRRPETNDL